VTAGARVIAELRGIEPGPTLIVIGGIHGNEPAGIVAARAAIGALTAAQVRGELVALVGNLRASAFSRRYLTHDLNRMWTDERIASARTAAAAASVAPGPRTEIPVDAEVLELIELSAAIDRAIQRARGSIYLLDLHTTSADGYPFAVVGPTPEHREFAAAFQLPGIAGLEEALAGVLTAYFGRRGCITLAIEGGQHTTGEAADNLSAVITIALDVTGVVPGVAGVAAARAHLQRVRGELPAMIEVALRHPVKPEHAFRMEPGFRNIQRTTAGTLLARDRTGEIRAPFDGVVLLPLYQPDGTDGFFYGRPVS
jgi:succinylglutamate desuccinylase